MEKVAEGFEEALEPLHTRLEGGAGLPELVREVDVAMACALHFQSVSQQSRFVSMRTALLAATSQAEGEKLLAVLDSNSDPDGIAFPIPGNDDAARAIALYCDLAARAVIDGLGQSQTDAGVDLGAAEEIVDAGAVEPATA